MIVMEPINSKPLPYGTISKNNNYYVIMNKETGEFDADDGNLTEDIMDACWFSTYLDAKGTLSEFDEPELFEIVRISCLVNLEEVME